MTLTTAELMNQGMQYLTEKMGAVEAEAFIAAVIRERFDYTKWQRTYFDAKSPESIREEALAFAKSHPFTGNATRI